MKTILIVIQVVLLIALAPLLSGIIRKIKNIIRMRKGAGIFQPYYNLSKLFSKDEIISENASWIFRLTPYIVLGSAITALLLVPSIIHGSAFQYMGDFILIIFTLSLGRFFLALAGMDTASAFGGMGSSREMFISALVEPVALISIFAVALNTGSTNLNVISGAQAMSLPSIIAVISLLMVTISETSRLPIDNQETHLELTMVHEAMVLEYSGRSLALIELAAHVKQILFFSIISVLLFPDFNTGLIFVEPLFFALKLAGIAVMIAFIEISTAKIRLFRIPDFLAFSFILSCLAVVISALGM